MKLRDGELLTSLLEKWLAENSLFLRITSIIRSDKVVPHDHKPAGALRKNPALPARGQNKKARPTCPRSDSTAQCCRTRWLPPTPCVWRAGAVGLVPGSACSPPAREKYAREIAPRSHKCFQCRRPSLLCSELPSGDAPQTWRGPHDGPPGIDLLLQFVSYFLLAW